MSKISFENFGYVSSKSKNFTISASRYLHQKYYEQKNLFERIQMLRSEGIHELNPL